MKKLNTLLFGASLLFTFNSNAQCVLTATAMPSACIPGPNIYSVSGSILFVGAPSTGTLTVVNTCGGSQTFSPPFMSPTNFIIPGINADGATCTVICSFSDAPTCLYTTMYTAPVACGTTSINENAFLTNLLIAPNPTNNSFNLSFDQTQIQSISIEIVDVLGRTVYVQSLPKFAGTYDKKIDLTSFNKGIYFVRITGENSSKIQKIIYY